MFAGSYFPTSYYPPSYFPKNGALVIGGSYAVGGRRRIFRHLAETDILRQERRRLVGQRMNYRTFIEAIEQMEVQSEIRRRQRLLTAAAYSTILAEI